MSQLHPWAVVEWRGQHLRRRHAHFRVLSTHKTRGAAFERSSPLQQVVRTTVLVRAFRLPTWPKLGEWYVPNGSRC